jgi:gliding motility-associated-like protein
VNTTIKMNFLSTTGLVNYGNHVKTPVTPFQHLNPTDPMAQYLGSTDAAQLNGSEQVYLPLLGGAWRSGTKMISRAPSSTDVPTKSPGAPAINIYGRAFDDANRGYVLYEGAHNVGGTTAAAIAAQRIFFNFSFFALKDKASATFSAAVSGVPAEMKAGTAYNGFTVNVTGSGSFTYQWKSSVPGTFSNPTGATTSFTPASNITSATNCVITCVVTDNCGRSGFDSKGVVVLPASTPITAAAISKTAQADCGTAIPINFNVFDYNVDANAGTRTLTAVTGFTHGTVSFNAAGNITYTADDNYHGTDQGSYTISNGTSTGTANITISVGDVTVVPSLTTDAASVIEDNLTVINVLANDKNNAVASSYDKLYIRDITVKPTKGYVYINSNGTLSYLSSKDAASGTGADSFKYLACNDQGYCSEGTVNITVLKDACTTGNYQTGINTGSTSDTTIFYATKDSYLNKSKTTNNYGTATSMLLNSKNGRYPIMQFDLSSINSSTTISNASLILTFQSALTSSSLTNNTNPFTANIYQSRRAWTETGVTWTSTGSVNWSTAGAGSSTNDYNSTNGGNQFLANSAVKAIGDTIQANITSMVQGWITTPSSNNGLIMYARSGASTSLDVKFFTKNYTTVPSYQPALRVVKTVAGTTYPCSAIPTTYKPVAYPDKASTTSASAATISVMTNDANFYGRSNSLFSVTVPAHGTAAISGNNIIYTPNGSFVGVDTFTYTIKDATNNTTNTATVRVAVSKVAPTILHDAASTNSGTAVSVNVGANDSDPQGGIGAPIITEAPKNGTVTVTGGNVLYTPSGGFTGQDWFVYKRISLTSNDCEAELSDTAIVRITVLNQPPVATNDAATTLACVPVKINVLTNDSDPEGAALTVTIVANPTHGSVSVSSTGVVTYTPTGNYTGTDQFTYKVTEGTTDALQSNTATVSITVTGDANVNHSPVAGNDADVTLINQPITTGVLDNDSDPDNDDLTVNITASGLLAPAHGTLELLDNGSIRYTPAPGFTGTDTYQYQICDSHAGCGGPNSLCAVATVTITVKPIPVFLSGKVWDDANGSANGTFTNIFTSGEVGTSARGSLHVYVVNSSNVVLDEAIVDDEGDYLLINVPPNTNGLKLILSTADVEIGATLSSGTLPSGYTNSTPLVRTGINSGTTDLSGYDFGIGELPVAISYAFDSQVNTGSQITLDATKITGTDGDGSIVSIHYTTFPTNITSIQIGATTYTSGTWPGAGVTVAVNTAVKILPLAGSVTPVISFKVIDNAGLESPSAATISVPVYVPLAAGSISGSATLCGSGIPAAFTSATNASGGRSDLIYQWQSSTTADFSSGVTDIPSANSAAYTPANTISATTYFRRKVSTSLDAALYSNIITVTINALPTVASKTDGSRTGTGTVTISATPSAGAAIDWYAAPTGGTALSTGSNSYTTPSISATTTYYAQARNTTTGCLSATRTPVNAVVGTLNPGVIGSSQVQCGPGAPASFTSVSDASGGTITYQWQSSTSSTFASGVVDLADDESATTNAYDPVDEITVTTYYRRKATSGANVAYSNIVSVTVNAEPAVPTVTGAARTGAGTVTLSATVPAGVSVDWYNVVAAGTVFLSGSTSFTTSLTQTTTYYVEARDLTTGCVSDTRAAITATINPNLSGGSISGGGNICGSGTPTPINSVNPALGGTGSYTYQWQISTTSTTSGFSDIVGANGLSYTPGSAISTTTYYRRKVTTSTDAAVYSNVVTYTVLSLPQVSVSPAVKSITLGSGTTLTANGANTYAWSPATNLSATNTAAVVASPTTDIIYTVTGTDGNNCTNTATATITVNPALSAGSIGSDQTICKNTAPAPLTSTTAASGGSGTISYQWQSSTNNISFVDIPGVTGATYTPGTLTQTTYFRRGANTTSDAYTYTGSVAITVLESVGGTLSGGATVCAGTNNVPLTLTGITGTITKWQTSTTADFSANVVDVPNVSTSLSASNLTTTTYYRAVVQSGTCPVAYSSVATVTVNPLPVITVTPTAAEITYGKQVTLTASGANSYTWTPATGLSATNTVSVTATPYSTSTYTVTGTDNNNCTGTATVVVTVNPLLTAGVIAADQIICTGATPNPFTSTENGAGGTGTRTYQWQSSSDNINFTNIPSTNSTTYAPGALTQTTYYRRGVSTATDDIVYTGSVVVTVNASVGGTISGTTAVCADNNSTILNLNGKTGSVVKWQSSPVANFGSGVVDIANTSTSYTASNLSATTYYRAVVQNGSCPAENSATATVTVNPKPVLTVSPDVSINAGDNTVLTASGANTYTWTPATGLSATNTISVTASPAATTTYTVIGASAAGCTSTASVTVTVVQQNNVLYPGEIQSSQTICVNTAPATLTSLTAAVAGTGTLTYSWESSIDNQNFAPVGVTTENYTPGTLTQTTYYRRKATDDNGSAYSNSVTITVNESKGGTATGGATVCVGANSTNLSVSNYVGNIVKWQTSTTADFSANNSDIAETTAGITVTNITTTRYYRAVVQNGGCDPANSSIVTITAVAPPVVTISPTSFTVTAGTSTTISLTGDADNYTWTPSTALNTTSGPTVIASPTSTITYTVTGTKTVGSCTSTASATVDVVLILTSGSIAADQTICTGTAPAAFTSTEDANGGNGTRTYQWQSSTNNISFSNISGANSATYAPGTLTQTTYYRRGVSTPNDPAIYTNSVKVTVLSSVGGSLTPLTSTVCAGTNNVPISLSGITGNVVKWQSSPAADFSTGVVDITNTTTSYSASNLTSTTYYRAVVQNGSCATANSSVATVTVNALPVITVTPSTVTITSGSSTVLTASGANTYSWVPSTGLSTTNTLSVTANPSGTTIYTVTGTNTGTGCINTASVTVNVNGALTPGDIGSPQTICVNTAPATLTSSAAAAGGTGALTYTWQVSTDNINFVDISGANSATYSPGTLTQTTYFRRAVETSSDSRKYTGSVKITTQASAGGSATGAATVCAGTNSTNLSVSGYTGSITKWQSSPVSDFSSGVVDIVNTSAAYTATNLSATRYYRAVIQQSSCPTANSGAVAVTVNAPPTVGVTGSLSTITSGQSSVLTASGANTYTWTPATGLSATNTISVTASPTTTTTYTVIGLNTVTGCSATATFTVTVNQALTPGSVGSSQAICIGKTASTFISAVAASGGTGAITYQWQSSANNADFTDIGGANAANYSPGAITQTTYYRRKASTVNDGAVYTSTLTVTVKALPVITISPAALTIPRGTSAVLTASGAATYTWTPTTSIVGATTTISITVKPLTSTTYTVSGEADNFCTNTQTITVTVANELHPDFGVTNVNVPLSGNVATNDQTDVGSSYGIPAAVTGNPAGASITMNANGTYTFTGITTGIYKYWVPVCASGQSTGCPVTLLQITVLDHGLSVNPPVANTDIFVTKQDVPVTGDVLANDKCANINCTLNVASVTVVTVPKNGTATANSNGTITYTPNNGYSGLDSLVYSVCDNHTPAPLCATATVYYHVLPAAVVSKTMASDDYAATISGGTVTGNLLTNDKHTAGATLSVTANGSPLTSQGTLTVNPNGSFSFTAAADYTGSLDITYTTCGGTPQSCANATLHLLVLPLPIDAVNDDFTAKGIDGAKGGLTDIVLLNDRLNNDSVRIADVNISIVNNGGITGLSLTTEGALSIPPNTQEGTYTITYQICEKARPANCDQATVTVNIVRGLGIEAETVCINDVPYIRYKVTPNFLSATNPVTITWLNGDKTVLAAVPQQTGRPLVDTVLWPGAVLDSKGNPIDWPGWYIQDGVWFQGADGYEKTRPDAYMVISVNPTDTIRISYPPATPACAASPDKYTLVPGNIAASQTICEGATPAALTSVAAASGGAGDITYRWESSMDKVNFTAIAGADAAGYAPATLTQNTHYRRVALSASGQYAYSDTVTITITPKPITNGGISGPCAAPKDSQKTYTVPAATNATHYVWTLPNGWTGTSATNSITVKTGTTGGVMTVTPYNGSCAGTTSSYAVTVIDYTRVTISGVPVTASGNNNSSITVTVELFDINGNRIHCSGGVASLCSNSGTFSTVIDNLDGTYTSQLTSSANDVTICGSVDGVPIDKKIVVTFTGPQGGISGNGPILATETPKITFTATAGRAPYTVIYRAGNNTKTDTLKNVTSGVPVAVPLIPETTLYTLVSVIDANGERRDNNFNRDTATIIVLAPKVIITLKAGVPKLERDSSWATVIHVRTKNIGTLDLFNSQAKLSLREVFPNPVTYVLDSVSYQGTTIVPNRDYDGEQNNDLFAKLVKPVRSLKQQQGSMYAYNRTPVQILENGANATPDGSGNFAMWSNVSADLPNGGTFMVNDEGDGSYMFGALSNLPIGVEATMVLYLHVKPNGYTEPFVMQAVALGTGKTAGATALATSLSNDNEDVNMHPEITKQGDPVPTMINLFPSAVLGTALKAGTPVLQGNGSYNVPMTLTVKNYGNVNLKSVNTYLNLSRMIGAPSTFTVTGPITATGSLLPNLAYNGSTDSNLVAAGSQIGYKQSSVIQFMVNIVPNQLNSLYQLQATGTGFSEDLNTTVTDLSNNGTDPDPDGNSVPSEQLVTDVVINIPVPPLVPAQIGIQTGSTTTTLATSCGTSGSITVIPTTTSTGGLSAYQYQWQQSTDNVRFTDIAGAVNANYQLTEVAADLYLRRATISGSLIAYSNAVKIQIFTVTKPVITVVGSNVLTWNGTVTLSSSASASYLWSNAATSRSVDVAAAGYYKVRTTDANGCLSNSDEVMVLPPAPRTIDSTYIVGAINNPLNSGGQVTVLPGATTNYYILSTGGTLIPVPALPGTIGQYTYYVSQTVNGIESAIVPYKVTMLDPMLVADVQKVVSKAPELQADGSFLMEFTIRTKNLRSETLDSVRIKDDLTKVFTVPTQFQVVSVKASGQLVANSLYNGNSNIELLSDGSKLAGLKTDSIMLGLKVTPNGYNGTLKNTAEQTAKSPFGISRMFSNDPALSNGLITRAPTPFVIPAIDIFIPSGFSPNRDGTNDRFVIIRPYNTTIHMEVFNRWGNLVYKAPDYQNEWDGRGNQPGRILGEELPDGTYYYIVLATDKATGKVRRFTGYITLKR